MAGMHEIWPHLRLHQHELTRPDEIQQATRHTGKVHRAVNRHHTARVTPFALLRQSVTGGRGGRQHNRGIRRVREQSRDQFPRHIHLSDAHRVHPKPPQRQLADRRARRVVMQAEPLEQIRPLSAASRHFHERARQHEKQADGQQQVVEDQGDSQHGAGTFDRISRSTRFCILADS